MDQFMVTHAVSLFVVGICLITLAASLYLGGRKPKVIELKLDPPEGAIYTQIDIEPEAITQTDKERIKQAKKDVILWHVVNKMDGVCTISAVQKCIKEEWNKNLEDWPEYKEWLIGQSFIRDVMGKSAWENGGGVLHIDGLPYVMIDTLSTSENSKKATTRMAVPLSSIVSEYTAMNKQRVSKEIKRRKLAEKRAAEPLADFKEDAIPTLTPVMA